MPYSQKNNPMKMMKSALKMYKDDKKKGMHRDSAMYMEHGMHRDSSMYMKDGMHRESVKQEKKDLMDYNPIDDRAGSPATAAKPDFPDIDGDGNTTESMKKAAADKKKGSPATKYDRVVLGGNKGDKSKTKPGKEDYMGKK